MISPILTAVTSMNCEFDLKELSPLDNQFISIIYHTTGMKAEKVHKPFRSEAENRLDSTYIYNYVLGPSCTFKSMAQSTCKSLI